MDCR